jgi:RNA polymerase sigma factor (sigma-70 family)
VLRQTSPSLLDALVRHYDDLVSQVRRRFGHAGFAREVVHDVCVQIIEKPPAEPVRVPLALLRRISHDLAIDRCRAEDAYRARFESGEVLPEVDSAAPDAGRVLDAQRELEWLAEAIAALPPRCQTVFVMHKIHEMPQPEVALRLGISRQGVEKHLRNGVAACRQHLEDMHRGR